jgi:hypothetical protein
MKTILRSFIFVVAIGNFLNAQTLAPGAIAFLSYQTNAPDGFAFVTLQDLPQETSISFTDNGWNGFSLFANEQTLVWTSPDFTLPIGTVITVRDNNGVQELIGPGAISGGLPNLSASGDQVLAYTGTDLAPEFIAGITNSNWLTTCNTAVQTNTTCLPSPLVNGVNAQSPVNSETVTTNMFFELGELNGTPDQIRTALMNWNNWTVSSDVAAAGYTVWPDWEFSVSAPAPLNLTVLNSDISLIEGASSTNIEFVLDGPAYGNQRVGFLISGMSEIADLALSPAFVNDTLWIEFQSGSSQSVLDISAVEDGLSEGTEASSLLPVSFSAGIVVNPNPIALSIDDLQGLSILQFTTESQSIAEGGTLNITVSITPPVAQASNFSIQVVPQTMLDSADYSLIPESVNQTIEVEVPVGASELSIVLNATEDEFPEATEVLGMSILEVGNGLLVGGSNEIEIAVAENDQDNIPVGVYLNEAMANNDTTVTDENGIYSDWIEIYNAGGGVANLEGLYISDDILNPYKYRFSSLDLMPGSFTLLWADDSTELGNRHLNFRLSASGEELFLFAAADVPVLIDSMNIPALTANQSYGSPQNGNQNRQIFDVGFTTPAASNLLSSVEQFAVMAPFNLYPNPARSGSFVTIGLKNVESNLLVQITDMAGRIVYTANTTSFVLPELKSGCYAVLCSSAGSIKQARLIVF